MKALRIVRKLSTPILLCTIMLLFGTVGGLEHGTMPYTEGVVRCIVYVALITVSTLSIKIFGGK